MRTSTLPNLIAVSALMGFAHSRVISVQGRQIHYCGSADEPTIATSGDPVEGPGIWVTNNDNDPNVKYFIYENSRDEHPWKYLDIPQGSSAFIQVCPTFQGRVVRGTTAANLDGTAAHGLGTWVEFSLSGGVAWGDISFLEGCDGGAGANQAARAWLDARCDADQVYIQEPSEAIIASADGRFDVVFADGVA